MGLFESGPTLQICSPNHTWIRWHWLSLRQFSSSKSWGQQCPYRVLGLSQNADIKSIKAAYITLSKKYHPDVNTSPQAGDQFRAVSEAYEVIGSAVAKKRYDDKLAAERRQNPYKSCAQSRGGTHPPPRPPRPPDNIHVRWENYLNEEKLNRERRAQYVRMRKNPFNVLDRGNWGMLWADHRDIFKEQIWILIFRWHSSAFKARGVDVGALRSIWSMVYETQSTEATQT